MAQDVPQLFIKRFEKLTSICFSLGFKNWRVIHGFFFRGDLMQTITVDEVNNQKFKRHFTLLQLICAAVGLGITVGGCAGMLLIAVLGGLG